MGLMLYLLRPLSAFHLGTGRSGNLAESETLARSDTIAAAILALWRHVKPNASAQDVAQLAANPPFAVSSMLPAIKRAGDWEAMLPVPPGAFDALGKLVEPAQRKIYKAVRFTPADALAKLLGGQMPADYKPLGEVLIPKDCEASSLWRRDSRLRLAVNRLGHTALEGLLYDFGAVFFNESVRLALIVEFIESAAREPFEAALRLLADEGLGGDRSCGYGRFELEATRGYEPPRLGAGARLTLSLLHPTEPEVRLGLLKPPAAYTVVNRAGWVTAPGAAHLRRKTLNMLVEGSLVRDLGRKRYGDSPVVLEPRPELGLHHPIYRPGCAVTLPAAASKEAS